MIEKKAGSSVERMFPFVLRARILIVGRDVLARSRGRLHFVLITKDISENSRQAILEGFAHYPVVQHYTSADLETHFGLRGTKVIGFKKSNLAQSVYAELKAYRLNTPADRPGRKSVDENPAGENPQAHVGTKNAQGAGHSVKPVEPGPKSKASRDRVR